MISLVHLPFFLCLVKFIDNFTPTKSDRVCSLHFDSGDIKRDLQLELLGHDPKKRQRARKLKPESVPWLPEYHPGAIESKSSKTREHCLRRAERAAHQEALREILGASQAQALSEAGVENEEAGEASAQADLAEGLVPQASPLKTPRKTYSFLTTPRQTTKDHPYSQKKMLLKKIVPESSSEVSAAHPG
ncbi:hypothetical protein CAPTEDRAFT_197247 [Capitella teleta]|uniref:THAP-type domain-containing protein n=1 Tax=Capitella teleta TaxID=283909 RepID=R7VFK4_CAPTE|nr:hypothetical protein CAPTEDRAFT_197247 [Capitella teleta]|eukprot:ELU17352.1 hypothetical protein CAPTEDRAFT_197247 [Capitella teleta]